MKPPFQYTIRHYKKIDSTNTKARKLASKGAPEGLVLTADYQTCGRGRHGNKWVSPPGKNLLFSLLIRPPIRASRAPILTQIACRSVGHVLKKKYGLPSTFKRPNDVLVHGKKICGVLIETRSGKNHSLESAVIGIGLNFNATRLELPPHATSLKDQKNRNFNRASALNALIKRLRYDMRVLYDNSP